MYRREMKLRVVSAGLSLALSLLFASFVFAGSGPVGTPGSDKTIKAQVEALQKAVGGMLAVITNLNTQVASLQKGASNTPDVSGLTAQIASLQASVSSMSAVIKEQDAKIASLETALSDQAAQSADLQGQLDTMASNRVFDLEPFVSVAAGDINGLAGPHIVFNGANVHIQSGSGATNDGGLTRGLGNLVIGYNEAPYSIRGTERKGSHNLVVGPAHRYSSFGGLVAGSGNAIMGQSASIAGGENNIAVGNFSSISGGTTHQTFGVDNWAGGTLSSPN